MESHPRNERPGLRILLAGVVAGLLVPSGAAQAREAESEVAAPVPCALIASVAGEVDLLDSSRTHLLDSSAHAAVPCGGWVSVGKGSVEIKHRDGFMFHLGAGTFVQLPEPNTDGKGSGDHAVLFRGQVFAQAGGGNGELRVVTANSRVRVRRGSAIIVYNHEDEETQLIALDSSSSIENRFEPKRIVTAHAGEATSLNFKKLRVVPETPRAVAMAALRPKFDDLRVPERDRKASLSAAQSRQERTFAAALVNGEDEAPPKSEGAHSMAETRRDVASVPSDATPENPGDEVRERLRKSLQASSARTGARGNYASHEVDAQTQASHKKWVSRLVAGQAGAEGMLAPKAPSVRKADRVGSASQASGAAGHHNKVRNLTPEDEEKLKLIDELSRIHEE